MKYELRPYQAKSVDRVLSIMDKIIECAPTGSGKTVCQAFVCKGGLERGERTAILTPRAEIFDQTHSALMDVCGHENVATLRSGHRWDSMKPVHVVSWPTLVARKRKSDLWLPDVDRVLVDEVHLALAPKVGEILDYYADRAHVVGYSATPARQTGKGLGTYFDAIHQVTTVRQLIEEGFLCPHEYWGGKLPDLEGVRTVLGDFEKKELGKRCLVLVGDIVDNWMRLAKDRQTIVFAVDIAHAEALADRFLELGVSAGSVHNKLTPERRTEVVAKFRAGFIQVLVNVNVLSYGFDAPSVSCVVAARPTKSIVMWLQQLGRGMRPHPGKDFCMLLDHTDNTRRLGMAEDTYSWELDGGNHSVVNATREQKEKAKEHTYTCEDCSYMFTGTRECPRCGWEAPFSKRDVAMIDADLVRIGKYRAEPLGAGWPTHELFWRMLKFVEADRGYKVGWAYYKFKDKAGVPPDRAWEHLAVVPPTVRVANWIRSRNIAYAKRKRGPVQGGGAITYRQASR